MADAIEFNAEKLTRLRNALQASRKHMSAYRESRLEAIKQFVGRHYAENAALDRVPLNLIGLAILIYARNLAARTPRTMVNTQYPQLRPVADVTGMAVNHLLSEISFGETLKAAAIDALLGCAVVKVGLEVGGALNGQPDGQEPQGFTHDVGQPYADLVDLDDFVIDMTARRYDQVQFAGNRYRVPLSWAQENELFDAKARKQLTATVKNAVDEDKGVETSKDVLTKSSAFDEDEYEPFVELWDLWLPFENLFITFAADSADNGVPLRAVEWYGPETGPYHILGFQKIPNQILPLPPASMWLDIHELANKVFRKLGRQAEREKTVLGIPDGSADDGKRIIDANDGDGVRMDNPDKIREYKFGGVSQLSLAFLVQLRSIFSWQAGNLDSMGGLSAMAETLGQDQLLAANSSKMLREMQDQMLQFAQNIIKSLAWYLWTDPLIDLPMSKRIEGTGIDVQVRFNPEVREGDFLDYNFSIDPFSMQDVTPNQKMQTLMQIIMGVVAPFQQQMAAQGVGVSMDALFDLISQWSNLPELKQVLVYQTPQLNQNEGPVGTPPNKPSITKRTYERVNRSSVTRPGEDMQTMQQLMGAASPSMQQGVA